MKICGGRWTRKWRATPSLGNGCAATPGMWKMSGPMCLPAMPFRGRGANSLLCRFVLAFRKIREVAHEKHGLESFSDGGDSDSGGGLRPAPAWKSHPRDRHHQGKFGQDSRL